MQLKMLLHYTCCFLQEKFDWAGGGVESEKPILSYGPCQFPTLGLIVQRAWYVWPQAPEHVLAISPCFGAVGSRECSSFVSHVNVFRRVLWC